MIAPYRITWNGYSSVDKNIITQLSFDVDSGEIGTYLGREVIASDVYDGSMKKGSMYKWGESLAPKITFIKEGFEEFTHDENRDILSWLTSKKTAGFLTVYHDDSEVISYEILGNWTNIQQYKLGNAKIIGYVCEFTSLTPYAFSPLNTITQNVSSPALDGQTNVKQNVIKIDIDTDELESAVYPRITIQQGNDVVVAVDHAMITDNKWIDDDWMDGTIYYYADAKEYYYNRHNEDGSIEPTAQPTKPSLDTTSVIVKNLYVDNEGLTRVVDMRIANNAVDEKIIVDGANKVISSSSINRIFDKDFVDWAWLPLYNGTNTITVIGNCTVTLEWREVRKVGEY